MRFLLIKRKDCAIMIVPHHFNNDNNLGGIKCPFFGSCYISVEIRHRNHGLKGYYDGVATKREVFYSAISQGVALFL